MPKELNLPEWMLRNNGFDEKQEKTLKLPDWMIEVSGKSFKKDLSTTLEDERQLENSRKLSTVNTKAISKSRGINQLCNNTIESKLESHKIALQCDTILESLNQIESDYKVISLDLDWPSAISSVISKSSTLHICYGVNACSLFSIENIKSLPKVFVALLNHSKIRLVGNNIVSDLLKIGLDFNLDVKESLETKLLKSGWDKSTLSCPHKWNLLENPLKFVHHLPPNRKDTLELLGEERTFVFSGEIKYVSNFSCCARISEELLAVAETKNSKFVIGFDLEWPYFRGHSDRVSLMQLCINNSECFLFHFVYFKSLPKTLVLLLNHRNVILTGLNIKNDIRKLSRDFRVDLTYVLRNNLIELTTFANDTLNCSERWSLARLVLYLTNKNLCKEVRKSNWSGTLSEEQKVYAATDAYVCFSTVLSNVKRKIKMRVGFIKLGIIDYIKGLKIQNTVADSIKNKKLPFSGVLLLLEHPPVYTVGIRTKGYTQEDEIRLKSLGADFYKTNRGGLITFHGPGQLVVYPIVDLKQWKPSVRCYIKTLETTVIDLCSHFNVKSDRLSPYPGIWVGEKKICAVGVHVSRYVTTHGIALNCNVDLTWFNHIVPCGIEGKGVTTLKQESALSIDVQNVQPVF